MFILKTCCNKEKPVVRTGLWFRAHFCPLLPWLRTSLVLILCLLDICYADSCICSSCTDWAELPLWLPNLQELCRRVPCHGGYRLAMCSFLLFGDWVPRFHIQIPYIAPFFAWGRTIDISLEWTAWELGGPRWTLWEFIYRPRWEWGPTVHFHSLQNAFRSLLN